MKFRIYKPDAKPDIEVTALQTFRKFGHTFAVDDRDKELDLVTRTYGYCVSEISTGTLVTHSFDQDAAVTEAKAILTRAGKERFIKAVTRARANIEAVNGKA